MLTIRRLHTDERGFTLTELLTTVLILGILLSIAVPSIQQQISRQQLTGSARELRSVLRNARSAAINEGVPRYVLLRPGEPGSYQVYRFFSGTWVVDRNEVPLKGSVGFNDADVTMPALVDVPVSGASVPPNAVYFDTRGRYPFGHGNSYTITLRAGSGDPMILTFYPQTGQVTGP